MQRVDGFSNDLGAYNAPIFLPRIATPNQVAESKTAQ